MEAEVKNFKALVFQLIKKQKVSAPAKLQTVQTIWNKSGQSQTTFNKMRQAQTSFIAAPIPMASTSTHDPTDLSFLDDVYLN